MKNITKVLLLALALVLTFALVACGNDKPPVDDVTTEDPAVTTDGGAAQPPVTTAPTVEPDEFTLEDYYALYVTDSQYFHLNFAAATADGPALVGSADYENTEVSAQKRFEAAASNYNPYLINGSPSNVVWGGTAKILTPWYFEDHYKDGFVKQNGGGDGNVANMRTEAPAEYLKTVNKGGQEIYVSKGTMLEEGYYFTDGEWARKTAASSWGNGYLDLGMNSVINFDLNTIATSIKTGYPMSYTIELTFKKPDINSGSTLFLGTRYSYNPYQETYWTVGPQNYGFLDNATGVHKHSMLTNLTDLMLSVNNLSFTYDFSDYSNSGNATACVYSNGSLNTTQVVPVRNTWEGTYINPGANGMQLFAVRVYNKALSEEEVLQNHFADIALVGRLDISGFLAADDAKKLEVYQAFMDFTADTDSALSQMVLDSVLSR